jgi:hypothetical protein
LCRIIKTVATSTQTSFPRKEKKCKFDDLFLEKQGVSLAIFEKLVSPFSDFSRKKTKIV